MEPNQLERVSPPHPPPSEAVRAEGGGANAKFRYVRGQILHIDTSNPVEDFRHKLKVKGAKIEAWWHERGKHYWNEGYRFLALTLTFRDEKSFEEFEEWGGRRRFMKEWKKENGGAVVDYVCVVEFQRRGVIHYHYLVVAKRGVRLSYPDESFFRWGMTNLKELRSPKKAYRYLVSYIKKLEQLDYGTYARWKAKFGRFRLYEFGRPCVSKRGALGLVEKGWGRVLYFKVLKDKEGWEWSKKSLVVRGAVGGVLVSAKWSSAYLGGLLLRFEGFRVGVEGVELMVESLDDLVGGLANLFEIKTFKEV